MPKRLPTPRYWGPAFLAVVAVLLAGCGILPGTGSGGDFERLRERVSSLASQQIPQFIKLFRGHPILQTSGSSPGPTPPFGPQEATFTRGVALHVDDADGNTERVREVLIILGYTEIEDRIINDPSRRILATYNADPTIECSVSLPGRADDFMRLHISSTIKLWSSSTIDALKEERTQQIPIPVDGTLDESKAQAELIRNSLADASGVFYKYFGAYYSDKSRGILSTTALDDGSIWRTAALDGSSCELDNRTNLPYEDTPPKGRPTPRGYLPFNISEGSWALVDEEFRLLIYCERSEEDYYRNFVVVHPINSIHIPSSDEILLGASEFPVNSPK